MFSPEDSVSTLAYLIELKNLSKANHEKEGTAMHPFQYFLEEPAKSLFAQRIVPPHVHEDADDYRQLSLTTYSKIVHTLLDIYALDDVIDEARAAHQDLKKKHSETPTKPAATLMSNSFRFSRVYTKLHRQPLLIAGIPENLRGMVRQKMADDPIVAYEKLA